MIDQHGFVHTSKLKVHLSQIKSFIITGKLYRSNKRFSHIYSNLNAALCINLWNGSIWAQLDNGKRILLKRVYN